MGTHEHPFPTVLEPDRLLVRQWVPDDWLRLRPLVTDPRVLRCMTDPTPWSDDRTRRFVNGGIEHARGRGWVLWPLILKVDSELIGFSGFNAGYPPDVEIGWWLRPEHWGRGLAIEAGRALLDYGFRRFQFPRAISVAHPANAASIGVMRKLGLRFKKNFLHDGIELVCYSITVDSWKEKQMNSTAPAMVAVALTAAPALAGPLDDALAKPAATGVLIAEIVDGGSAAKAGLTVGDIITNFGGTAVTDQKSFRDARTAAARQPEVPVTVVRDGRPIPVTVAGGPLGVKTVPVREGVAAELLPAASGAAIDLSQAKFPIDAWYSVEIDKKKAGYQHVMLTRDGDQITLKTELAFSNKDSDGDVHDQHYVESVELKSLTNPQLISSKHRFVPGNFENTGKVEAVPGGKSNWFSTAAWQEMVGDKPVTKTGRTTVPAPSDLLPDFGLELLAAYLPTAAGSCCHLTVMNAGAGDLTDRAALKAVGQEEIEVGGKKVRAARIDCHTIGDISRTVWVDDKHQVVRARWLLYSTFDLELTMTDRHQATAGVTAAELQPLD
jgi:ribosomal-protein-alanine N-acetyltransferase